MAVSNFQVKKKENIVVIAGQSAWCLPDTCYCITLILIWNMEHEGFASMERY